MTFYSHAKEEDGVKTGSKLLQYHLQSVYDKALQSFYHETIISIPQKDIPEIIRNLTYFHDLGKFTTFFQKYLLGEKINQKLKSHSLLGAIYVLNKYKDNPYYASLLYFLIINHHSSFKNILETGLLENNIRENYFISQQLKDIKNQKQEIEKELGDLDLEKLISFPTEEIQKNTRKAIQRIIKKNPQIQYYFTINYLFSLLIEADKLDASETPLYLRKPLPEKAVESFLGKAKLDKLPEIDKINGFEQNKLRNWVRASVLENLNDEKILEKKLFTLTAPTGIGKTLTVLDFALRLKKIIREKENFEPQIIYGLPFINIIEQGLNVYNEVFKNIDINILGHYQYADVFGEVKDNENEEGDGKGYNNKLMKLNTWQSDIVITSFVQFFETLISNRNKMLLKFNHLAGAIVILDEVQTLRLEHLPFIGAAIFYLSRFLNTKIILMTATKPKIFELANREILDKESDKAEPFELLKDYEKVFAKFNRTKIVPLTNKPLVTADDFYELFKEKRKENQSCLIVCNTVKRSIDIFNKLKEKTITNLYYLSTNIVPAARLQIINRIIEDIKNGKSPVLISTQVVEAGVDLDFDMGFRDLGPIDSIIQVAGRINRENNEGKELSPLYIVEFQKEKGEFESALVYDSLTRDQVLKSFKDVSEIPETRYLQLIEKYFSVIVEKEVFGESRSFYKSMKTLRYYSDDSKEYPVSCFKIIKDSPWAISVFVELNNEASKAYEAYNALLNREITKEVFDKNYKKTFNQYIIAAPEKFTEHLESINEFTENIKLIRKEFIEDNYDLDTGFIREGDSGDKVVML